jgi:Zn-dependent metalloprotease
MKDTKDTRPPAIVANVVNRAAALFLKTPAQGATTQIYLAAGAYATEAPPRAQYYVDCEPRPVAAYARDVSAAQRLWEESEEKAGVTMDWASVGSHVALVAAAGRAQQPVVTSD